MTQIYLHLFSSFFLFIVLDVFLKGNLEIYQTYQSLNAPIFCGIPTKTGGKYILLLLVILGHLIYCLKQVHRYLRVVSLKHQMWEGKDEISCILAIASITRLHAQLRIISSIDLNLF